MKYITAFLLVVLCVIGAIALILFTRDNPQYADGEPTAIVKDWLSKQPAGLATPVSINTVSGVISASDEGQVQAIWMEEYLGHGKWQVSRANIPDTNGQTMTFEEWISRTRGWDENRLNEYASDLSLEEQHTFQEQIRTYSSGQQGLDILDEWYLYEKSGLVDEVQD
jgi:hypothetical protein